jgi:hypothetical protein
MDLKTPIHPAQDAGVVPADVVGLEALKIYVIIQHAHHHLHWGY